MTKSEKNWSLIFAWCTFALSEVIAGLIIFSLILFDNIIWIAENPKWKFHATTMTVTMIIGNGHGMCLFRLFPSCKTRIIKYVHMGIHSVIILCGGFGYLTIHIYLDENDRHHFNFRQLHNHLAILTAIMYISQWFVAAFVYFFSSQRNRILHAPWHNFIGICIIQLSIITSCVQLHEMDFLMPSRDPSAPTTIVLIVVYGVLINLIVLNPYLEWRLVGQL